MGVDKQRIKETIQKLLPTVHDDNSTANLARSFWQGNEPGANLYKHHVISIVIIIITRIRIYYHTNTKFV